MAVFRYVVKAASSVESCLKGQNRLSPGYPLSVKAGRRLATHFITGNNGWLIPRLPRACHRPKYPCSCQKPRSRRVFAELQGNSLHAAAGDTGESERRQGYAQGIRGTGEERRAAFGNKVQAGRECSSAVASRSLLSFYISPHSISISICPSI